MRADSTGPDRPGAIGAREGNPVRGNTIRRWPSPKPAVEKTETAQRSGGVWTFRGKTLFPFQQRAAEAILAGKSVVVAAPTGAGKTLVADVRDRARAAREGRRVVYTSPIKALSNQKFRDFRAHYGDERVGIMTGDVTIQPDAPLLIMTTEIFRNTIFEDPERLDAFDFVIFDEIHYLDDLERGTVWEESILYAPPHVRVVALSATVPNVAGARRLDRAGARAPGRGRSSRTRRPVPLDAQGVGARARAPRRSTSAPLPDRGGRHDRGDAARAAAAAAAARRRARRGASSARRGDLPRPPRGARPAPGALLRASAGATASALARAPRGHCDLLAPEERERLLDALRRPRAALRGRRDAPSTRELRRLAARGVLFHHAGMLPIDKEIVERLFTTGLRAAALRHGDVRARREHAGADGRASTRCAKFDGVRRRRRCSRASTGRWRAARAARASTT